MDLPSHADQEGPTSDLFSQNTDLLGGQEGQVESDPLPVPHHLLDERGVLVHGDLLPGRRRLIRLPLPQQSPVPLKDPLEFRSAAGVVGPNILDGHLQQVGLALAQPLPVQIA